MLPLDPEAKRSLAVIGPLADARAEMHGCWAGAGDVQRATTFLEGLKEALPNWRIECCRGAGVLDDGPDGAGQALDLARAADMVLLCLGEAGPCRAKPPAGPGPTSRRRSAAWRKRFSNRRKPVIVTLSSGRPLTASWLFEQAPAVLATWFLGDEAGGALADVLTGRWSPSGRLPVSWPR